VNFVFHPDLFEHRARAMERLEAANLVWLRDFSSIDLGHEEHSLEICGIGSESTARKIETVLASAFGVRNFNTWFKDFGIEIGWVVEVFIPLHHIP